MEDIPDDDWSFETDFQGLKDMFAGQPFGKEADEAYFGDLWDEMRDVVENANKIHGMWPVDLMMASRK